VVSEMADLVYHSLVLLASRGIAWQAVEAELARRFK
jgi:phosphoribosyl-ATP pyrophosphohydrolase